MSKFKAGDLAIIVKVVSDDFLANLGRVVLVDAVDPEDKDWDVLISAENLVIWDKEIGQICFENEGWFHSSELMPLRGDFQPEQQKAKEVEA
ncbi:TPA: hypothetical protein ACLM19_005266 [Pseudomonas aeruginosa]